MRRILIVLAALALVISVEASASARTTRQASATARAASPAQEERRFLCNEGDPLCAETAEAIGYEGRYTGHDEPSVLYYSDKPGSGNNNRYRVVVPKDPPTLPTQDGTGGTFNFQNRIAFWFGMDLCDNQSAPEFTHAPCTPNSDTNIFDGSDPSKPDYIGRHPGTAFLELQFYPPGWVPFEDAISCDATQVVRGHGDLQLQQRPEHRRRQQRRLPEHGRHRAGQLRLHHQAAAAARARPRPLDLTLGVLHADPGHGPVHECGRPARHLDPRLSQLVW